MDQRQIRDQVTHYLRDAHSIEEQALEQLRRVPDFAGEPGLEEALRLHLHETEGQEERVRALLEERGSSPSGLKDTVMAAGGEGFVLFARVQPDTPGKLATHALSYEALEWASYDLLARTAERAGEARVAEEARSICDQERTMMDRLEGLLERTAEASLEAAHRDDPKKHLGTYLADAHALEAQSIQLLEAGVDMVADDNPPLRRVFEEHLDESRRQQELLERRLDALGESRSLVKDAVMRLGALNWGMFFQAHPDTAGKLAAFAYAFEHLEIGGYEQLRVVADRAGDTDTVRVVEDILSEERNATEALVATFDAAVEAALESRVTG